MLEARQCNVLASFGIHASVLVVRRLAHESDLTTDLIFEIALVSDSGRVGVRTTIRVLYQFCLVHYGRHIGIVDIDLSAVVDLLNSKRRLAIVSSD